MMTTGHLTSEAIKYSKAIMEDTNLCILTLQKEDIEVIIKNPASIIKIFNHQAESAKKIKVLNDGEQQILIGEDYDDYLIKGKIL